jgi:hypothetical protein
MKIMNHPYLSDSLLVEIDQAIDEDESLPTFVKLQPQLREVCRAGLNLYLELKYLGCSDADAELQQEKAGVLSRTKEVWSAHAEVLEAWRIKKPNCKLN